LADPETLEALGIQPEGPASGNDFVALMEGQHPATGAWLRRAGPDGSRGGGIDSVLSAPKSVSVVWALADSWQPAQIEQAHANAVEQTVQHMREHVPLVHRRYGAEVVEEPAKDLIAVEYRHTTARGVSGAEGLSDERWIWLGLTEGDDHDGASGVDRSGRDDRAHDHRYR
jgi:conjugative relaxase-like TrwC/TraI family protein